MKPLMKSFRLLLLSLPLVAGCLSSAPEAPVSWTIDFYRNGGPAAVEKRGGPSVRVSAVDVRAPFAGQRLVVLRPDGSVAFDAFNAFAGAPAQLLRGAACDAVEASGKFGQVLAANSAAKTTYAIELVVTQLALDCRTEGRREASVGFSLLLLRDRTVVDSVRGSGTAEAAADYSAAFSAAFARAMQDALGRLTVK